MADFRRPAAAMADPVRVGLLDSGVGEDLAAHVGAAVAFRPHDEDGVDRGAAEPDRLGHGSALAGIILAHAPDAVLLNAQVLGPRGTTSAAAVAAGLGWLVEEGADLITLSLGLRTDRAVLRDACAAAITKGGVLRGAAPARGAPVYPAAYDGVIRVTGDARCAVAQISHLASAQADFGACVRADDGAAPIAGSSVAVAHACGLVAGAFGLGGARGGAAARDVLVRRADFHGPERKTAADAG